MILDWTKVNVQDKVLKKKRNEKKGIGRREKEETSAGHAIGIEIARKKRKLRNKMIS